MVSDHISANVLNRSGAHIIVRLVLEQIHDRNDLVRVVVLTILRCDRDHSLVTRRLHCRGRADEPELERARRVLRELEKRGDLVRLGRGRDGDCGLPLRRHKECAKARAEEDRGYDVGEALVYDELKEA